MHQARKKERFLKRKIHPRTNPFLTDRKVFGLKRNDVLKFISSLLLPLALGVFTLVITLQQQQIAKQQREEDRIAADRHRELERNITDDRYKNDVFDAYIKEMGRLLENHSGFLTSNNVTATLARVKTLNVFRQLDSQSKVRIIRFLYEAGQLDHLASHTSLDLSSADLSNIDLSYSIINKRKLDKLSLAGAILSNATFTRIEMQRINFSEAQLDNASFAEAQLDNIDYSFSQLGNANFSSVKLRNVTFLHSSFHNTSFFNASLSNGRFLGLCENIDFSFTRLKDVDFSSGALFDVNFSYAHLDNVRFPSATLHNVNFSFANLSRAIFSNAQLVNANFSYSILGNVHQSFALFLYDIYFSISL